MIKTDCSRTPVHHPRYRIIDWVTDISWAKLQINAPSELAMEATNEITTKKAKLFRSLSDLSSDTQ